MVVRRRVAVASAARARPAAVRRVAPGAPAEAEVQVIQSAAALYRQKMRADQAAAASGRKATVPFSIGPVSPVHVRKLNMMIYGDYGFGKTTFAGSADDVPSMRDVLFINIDSGTMSVTNRRTMDFIDVDHYDQIARIFEFLSLHCYYRDQKPRNVEKLLEYERELKSGLVPLEDQTPDESGSTDPERTWFVEQRLRSGKPMDEPYIYETVIIDAISELHKLLIYKFTGVDITTAKLDEEVEKMDSWQAAQELFRLMVRAFRTLRLHTIFVSAQAIEPSERNKRRNPKAGQALPKLAGQMAGDIAGFVDIVGFLELIRTEEGGETRRLYLGAGYEGWISKHRFENLPDLDYVDNPTLNSLIELARKDAEAHGTSQARSDEDSSSSLTTTSNRASSAAAQRSSGTHPASGSRGARRGAGNGLRRRHGA